MRTTGDGVNSLTLSAPLKPCPFCGGNAKVIRVGSGYERLEKPYVAVCQNDDCGASLGQYSATKQEAADRWNERV